LERHDAKPNPLMDDFAVDDVVERFEMRNIKRSDRPDRE
jgi:hypothetical protein